MTGYVLGTVSGLLGALFALGLAATAAVCARNALRGRREFERMREAMRR